MKLEAIRAQFEDVSNYLKKKSCKIEQLETVINQLTIAKTKIDTVFSSVEISIDTS